MKTGKTVTLILPGDSGIGKSFFSCWMMHETREHIAHEYTPADLVVDEIGRYETKYEQQAIFDIADQRQKCMVLINRKKSVEPANYVDTAVMDRLNPTAVFIDTTGYLYLQVRKVLYSQTAGEKFERWCIDRICLFEPDIVRQLQCFVFDFLIVPFHCHSPYIFGNFGTALLLHYSRRIFYFLTSFLHNELFIFNTSDIIII